MKRLLGTLTALVATGVLAQPSIDQTQVGYVVGDSYTVATGTWDENAGPDGANVTWDFSGLDNSNTTALNVLDPAGTPSGASYPTSNTAIQVDATTDYDAMMQVQC